MRYFILSFVYVVFLMPISSYADCDYGVVIQWKYGDVARVEGNQIKRWDHPSEPRPDKAQLALDCIEYSIYIAREAKKTEVKKEGTDLIEVVFPALNDFDKIKLHKENLDKFEEVEATLSANDIWLRNMWNTGKDYFIALNGYTSISQFDNLSTVWPSN